MRNKLLVVGVAAVFFLACLGRVIWSAVERAGPAIECDQPVIDFGEKGRGEVIRQAFVLRNSGSEPLHITDVRSDCGCAVLDLPAREIAPGQSVPLTAQVWLQTQRGPIERRIVVSSNDRRRPALLLTYKGLVRSQVDLKPVALNFGAIAGPGPAEQAVDVIAHSPSVSFRLTKVTCDSPHFEAVGETLEPGRGYRVRVRTKGAMPPGSVRGTVHVQTDLAEEPEIAVPVTASVRRPNDTQ